MRNICIVAHPEARHHTEGLVGDGTTRSSPNAVDRMPPAPPGLWSRPSTGVPQWVSSSDLLRARQRSRC